MKTSKTQVSLMNTDDRTNHVGPAIDALGINPVKNKHVLVKPNFNTADPAPGSTHNDTLVALVKKIWDMGATAVSLGERSFPLTRQVMEHEQIARAVELGIGVGAITDIDVVAADGNSTAHRDRVVEQLT